MGRNKLPAVYIYLPMLNHPLALWQWVIFPRCYCNSSAPQWLSQPTLLTCPDGQYLDGAPAFPGIIFWGFLRKVQVTHGMSSITSPLRYCQASCSLFPTSFVQSPWKMLRSASPNTETHAHTLQKTAQTSASLGPDSGHSLVFYNCASAARAGTNSSSIRENIAIIRDLWPSLQGNWSCSLGQKLQHPGQSTSLLV